MGNLENIKIAVLGFEAIAETKESIQNIFKKLIDEVPYDAFIQVTLKKITSGYEGQIDISSIAGDFKSLQTEMTPLSLAEKLAKDLRAQLVTWRSKRFVENRGEAIA